jgi:hypothetical protein
VKHMSDTRSRARILVGLAAAAGAFGAAAMLSAASAPTARADDSTDVINVADGDLSAAAPAYADALTRMPLRISWWRLRRGLRGVVRGCKRRFLSAPDNLLVGTIEVATNESVTDSPP